MGAGLSGSHAAAGAEPLSPVPPPPPEDPARYRARPRAVHGPEPLPGRHHRLRELPPAGRGGSRRPAGLDWNRGEEREHQRPHRVQRGPPGQPVLGRTQEDAGRPDRRPHPESGGDGQRMGRGADPAVRRSGVREAVPGTGAGKRRAHHPGDRQAGDRGLRPEPEHDQRTLRPMAAGRGGPGHEADRAGARRLPPVQALRLFEAATRARRWAATCSRSSG